MLTEYAVAEITVFLDDLFGDVDRPRRLSGFGPVGLHLDFDNLEGVDDDGLGNAGAKTCQGKCLGWVK